MGSTSLRAELWRERLADWWAGLWRWVLLAGAAAAAAYIVLNQGLENATVTAFALAGLVIGAVLTPSVPLAIALMSMPALFIVQRVGLGAGDLSVSDFALAAAFGCAVLLGKRPYSRSLRALLWFNLFYQFTTLFTVIVNPYAANTFEWVHAWLLVSGALIVGWALGAAGYARLALSLLVVTACAIALLTVIQGGLQYVTGNFSPVYITWPFGMHKNFIGTALAFAAVVVYVNPDWVGWNRTLARWTLALLVVAILMTQSRQALVGLILAVVVVVIRRKVTGRSRLVLLLLIPAAWLIATMIADQVASQNEFNSVFQRLNWFREVFHYWRESPIFGHGLRYWYNDATVPFQPPQAEMEVLASAGIIGLIGFIVMWIGVLVVLWRVDPRYGTIAVAVVLSRIVQGQFDLFWIAAQVSIPFVIAGICLGALDREEQSMTGEPDAAASRRPGASVRPPSRAATSWKATR
ncbi:O-antigen ligase family protein [Agromyces sp. NPDC057865]|uniref:O-antigen ligase family protein n=1 Tax=Agromyces sp. NPDC057865 TaxID=3346267 RepID=UPI00366B5734